MSYAQSYSNSFLSHIQSGESYSMMSTVWIEQEPKISKPRFSLWDRIVCRLSLHRLTDKLNEITSYVEVEVSQFNSETFTKEQLIERHKSIKKMLDTVTVFKLEGRTPPPSAEYLYNSLKEFLSAAKQLEQKLRLAAYPERNQVVLTYDELKELAEITKDWQMAEEHSDVYDNVR